MKIEEALEEINSTNFYSHFTNAKQDEAFNTAYKSLVLCGEMKKDVIMLKELSDPIAHKIAAIFESKLETIEESEV